MSSSKSKGGRGLTYSIQETNDLLEITRELLPIGQEEWEAVCTQHLEKWPDSGRDLVSLRRKFNQLAQKNMPTGDPRCPDSVREAKRINFLIKQKADLETFSAEDEDEDEENEDDKNGSEEGNVVIQNTDGIPEEVSVQEANPEPRSSDVSPTAVGVRPVPNTPSNGSAATSTTNESIRQNLKRISVPKKKKSLTDDFSIQDFLKYTMVQREEDRRAREEMEQIRKQEEREERRQERLRREADDRMFRQLFMCALMQQGNGNGTTNAQPSLFAAFNNESKGDTEEN